MARMTRVGGSSEREQEQARQSMECKNIPAREPDLWSMGLSNFCINLIHNDYLCRTALYVRCVAARYCTRCPCWRWRWRRHMATYRGASSMPNEMFPSCLLVLPSYANFVSAERPVVDLNLMTPSSGCGWRQVRDRSVACSWPLLSCVT